MPVQLQETITGKGRTTYMFRGRTGETVGITVIGDGAYRGDERLGDVGSDPERSARQYAEGMIGLHAKVVGDYSRSHAGMGACGASWDYPLPSGVQSDDPEVSEVVAFLRGDKNVTVEVRDGEITVTRKHGL